MSKLGESLLVDMLVHNAPACCLHRIFRLMKTQNGALRAPPPPPHLFLNIITHRLDRTIYCIELSAKNPSFGKSPRTIKEKQ